MSLFSLIVALLLEQWRPLTSRRLPLDWITSYLNFFQQRFNAGQHQHGRMAWLAATGIPLLSITLTFNLLDVLHPLLALLFCILIVYLTLGFHQSTQQFNEIHQALRDGDNTRAATLLSIWRGMPSYELNATELARVAIEEALLAAHRHIFGVMLWFLIGMLLGLGPTGAVVYRLAQYLDKRWGSLHDLDHGDFGQFARRAHVWLEWLPLRLVAGTFAIVGDFEDAVFCWRTQAKTWPQPELGILLASGAGALGVRLGQPITVAGQIVERPELGAGDEADPDFMQSTTGLVWRTLVFWLIVLLLITLSTLVGG